MVKQRSVVWLFRSLLAAAIVVCLFPRLWAQPAGGDARSAFSEAYAAYTSAIEAGDHASALTAAKRAYESGLTHFGRTHDNTAALAMNYGNMLALGADNGSAAEMFAEADAIYKDLHGNDSEQRLEALLALASVQETFEERLASVEAALSVHRMVLPDDPIAYARLQSQAGGLLAGVSGGGPGARRILTEALETLEREFGEDSPELFATLVALGNAAAEGETPDRRQIAFLDRAVEIARASDSDEAVADLELQIAYQLGRQPRGYRHAMPYVTSAHDTYDRLYGADHPKTALATLTLAQAFIATGDREQGVSAVEKAIAFYEGKLEYVPNVIRARQLLMSVYTRQGDEARYTEQLMEVGRLSESLQTPLEYLPVMKVPPAYPEAGARCGGGADGYVVVEYTVDEEGRVQDPVVVESSSTCGRANTFDQAAVASVRQYRYIPRFEDGVPVSVSGVRTTITFEIE